MLTPSEFDKTKWGCPLCDFPLDRRDDMGDGGVTCACGVWVALPDEDPGPTTPSDESPGPATWSDEDVKTAQLRQSWGHGL